jgi:large subunit ribosomal protein L1
MAKSKKELLEEARAMGVEVTEKNTVAEITSAIAAMSQTPVEPVEAGNLVVVEAGQADEAKVAKAGKRSAKALKEAEEKQAKEARKADTSEEKPAENQPKKIVKPARTRLERRSKNYRKAAEQIDKSKAYTVKQALELATKTSPVKFNASVELHVNLGVDPRQADQNVRETVVLPAGTGKTVRIAVLSQADDDGAAKKAGADLVGEDNILKQLDKNVIEFDVLIATPAMMPKLGKYAKLLGPRGLMPNPKSGTVTPDVAKAVSEAKAGRVEYRVDSTGIIHIAIGKVSFGADKLDQNAQAVLASIKAVKPASLKGIYIKAVHVTTTMGPSITVSTTGL